MTSTLNKRSFNLTVFGDRVVIHAVFFRWPSYFAPQYLDAKKKSFFFYQRCFPPVLYKSTICIFCSHPKPKKKNTLWRSNIHRPRCKDGCNPPVKIQQLLRRRETHQLSYIPPRLAPSKSYIECFEKLVELNPTQKNRNSQHCECKIPQMLCCFSCYLRK